MNFENWLQNDCDPEVPELFREADNGESTRSPN